jgi:hypothetical protein
VTKWEELISEEVSSVDFGSLFSCEEAEDEIGG